MRKMQYIYMYFKSICLIRVHTITLKSNIFSGIKRNIWGIMRKRLKIIIFHMLALMIWVCHMQHHVARQISQFAKSIHNSSPISLASLCRLLCYPTEDRCGSRALWDPDGTFPTIRFGLPLENDPFPACDTNVSSSASNEMTPPNENLKNKFSLCLQYLFFLGSN